MIKVGIIGAGFMGGMHASCYEALGSIFDVKVCAVADINIERAQKLASKSGAKTYGRGLSL
jgi:predicted dehydrogenase